VAIPLLANPDTWALSSLLPFPPKHSFQTSAVGVRPGNRFLQQVKMRHESVVKLLEGSSKRRTILVRDEIVDGEVMPTCRQPVQHRLYIHVPLGRLDSAKKRMLEDPLELPGRRIPQKIGLVVFGPQAGGRGGLASQADSARGKVKADGLKPAGGPSPDIVARATTRDTNSPARENRMRFQKIHQAGGWRALLPRHILGPVSVLPIGATHEKESIQGLLSYFTHHLAIDKLYGPWRSCGQLGIVSRHYQRRALLFPDFEQQLNDLCSRVRIQVSSGLVR